MPEKKGDHSLAKWIIASILPLPSKIKIEIRLKNHELFKIVLHILVALRQNWRNRPKAHSTVHCLSCIKKLILSCYLCRHLSYSSPSCKSIPSAISSFNFHSSSREVPHPYIIPSMWEVNAAVCFSPLLSRDKGCFSFWNPFPSFQYLTCKEEKHTDHATVCTEKRGAVLHCCIPQTANVSQKQLCFTVEHQKMK